MRMRQRTSDRYLLLIAHFSFLKGALLLVVAVGFLHYLHRDVQGLIEEWIRVLHFDPHNRHIADVLARAGLVNEKNLEELSALTFFYAVIFLTEGVGLFFKKQWAKYFTVIATASFIPMEIYSLFHHFELRKVGLLVISIAIVWFLIVSLRREKPATYYYRPTVLFK